MSRKKDGIINDLETLRKLKTITNGNKKIENVNTLISLLNFKKLGENLLNLLFTPKCYICNEYFEYSNNSCVCDKCKEIYKQYEVNRLFFDNECKELGIGIYRYDGVIRFFIQKMKYEKNKKIAKALAELAEDRVREFIKDKNVNYIVPIPIHPKRQVERGFNQSEIIVKVLSEKLGVQMRTDFVIRSRYTVPQSKLKFEERKDNVKDTFEILKKSELGGKDIILVDDIYTTGSTIEECSRVLNEHNTRKVYFLSISVSNNKSKGECSNEN